MVDGIGNSVKPSGFAAGSALSAEYSVAVIRTERLEHIASSRRISRGPKLFMKRTEEAQFTRKYFISLLSIDRAVYFCSNFDVFRTLHNMLKLF